MKQEVATVGLDLATNVFQVHAVGSDGTVLLRRKLRRARHHVILSRQAFHHPGEHTHLALPLPAIIQCLVRAVFPGRILPAQAIPVDEDNPAQDVSAIHPWLAVALGEIGRQASHLFVRQPIQIAHAQSPRRA